MSAVTAEHADKQASLSPLETLLADDMKRVNDCILQYLSSDVPMIAELARHILAAGGKRLRPMVTLAGAKLCQLAEDDPRPIGLAASVEFIHTATLLHDDVVDDSDKRRGQATANQLWGNHPSILVGDFLFSRSFQLMVAHGNMAILRILSDASTKISQGEVDQLATIQNIATTEAHYKRVIEAKTAALFAAAAEIGPHLSEKTAHVAGALRAFGENFGLTFQIIDDILDYKADTDSLGKTLGDDFVQGKMTLPLILLARRLPGDDQTKLAQLLANETEPPTPEDFAWVVNRMHAYQVFDTAHDQAERYATNAIEALTVFPDSNIKKALTEAVSFSLSRDH